MVCTMDAKTQRGPRLGPNERATRRLKGRSNHKGDLASDRGTNDSPRSIEEKKDIRNSENGRTRPEGLITKEGEEKHRRGHYLSL